MFVELLELRLPEPPVALRRHQIGYIARASAGAHHRVSVDVGGLGPVCIKADEGDRHAKLLPRMGLLGSAKLGLAMLASSRAWKGLRGVGADVDHQLIMEAIVAARSN